MSFAAPSERARKVGIHTILGAGGVIGTELARELRAAGRSLRRVGRHVLPTSGADQFFAADLADREKTIEAVAGSSVVYLLAGLNYDLATWRALWPRIMDNAIEACKRADAKLVFFDNVYMYGKVAGAMTEHTPFNPCSRKGEIRAQIATRLLDEIKAGALTALIARSADFYGPHATHGVPNVLVFSRYAKGKAAYCLANDAVPHSYTYTADAGKALVRLADSETAWNQTWHLPTAPRPPTGAEFIRMAAQASHVASKYLILRRLMVRMAGWFDSDVRELYEMLYQNESEYLFDSAKFAAAFDFAATSYAQGIGATAASYLAR